MKYTILGFNQKKMIELKITIDQALILRYFIDFKDSGNMAKEFLKDDMYYWVNYEIITKEELPILKISKDRLYRILKSLCEKGILKHKTKREGGTFSFYAVGPKYRELISSTVKTTEGTVKIPEGYGKNTGEGTVKIPEPYGENNGTKDSSIKDSSIKKIYINIVEYLNKKANTNYKSSTKKTRDLINARTNEGFEEKDFYTVIDKKVAEWLGTDMEKYIRPETLFGNKFEGYLNQKVKGDRSGKDRINAKEIEDDGIGFTI
ncbi:conserved phage C-terminal domain-containing protein [Clostridium massiliodielmoense]|uniref:conserved phage C-terminal domain-containing protein n=1 Tax=Clostridium massiliodielmoense TaxID=1776385 RepID=UPI000A270E6E|nr:conserved phage C-terminal domain-containing protein [Clostridium massiliodielmoense]